MYSVVHAYNLQFTARSSKHKYRGPKKLFFICLRFNSYTLFAYISFMLLILRYDYIS